LQGLQALLLKDKRKWIAQRPGQARKWHLPYGMGKLCFTILWGCVRAKSFAPCLHKQLTIPLSPTVPGMLLAVMEAPEFFLDARFSKNACCVEAL
jgi:hypothetical protein